MGPTPSQSLVVLLTVLAGGRTLLLRDSIDRPVRLYRAPTPYYREGRPALSSVIITSKPLDINNTTTTTTTTPRPQWRRHSTDDVTDDASRMPMTRIKTPDFVTNSRRFSDFNTSDHRNSDYKTSDHKDSDYKTYDHKNSDFKTSDRKNSDFKTSDRKDSDYKTYDYKNSDYKTYDQKESDYKNDHKDSDFMTSNYKNSDYKNDYKNDFKTYDNKNNYDYKEHKNDHQSSELTQTDTKATEPTNTNVNIPFYNFECRKGETCSETINLEISTPSPTFKPYPQEMLDKFLKDYTKRQDFGSPEKQPPRSLTRYNDRELTEPIEQPTNRLANLYLDSEEPIEAEADEKPSWDLVPAEKHHHPYDDRDGWITLEPVPWSNSKVSKWHSLVKPNKRPSWDENQRPSRPPRPWDNANHYDSKPPYDWDSDRPGKPWDNDKPSKPWEDRPTKPWEDKPYYKPWEDKPSKPWEEKPSKPWEDRPTKPWENERPQKPSWESEKPSRPSSWDQDHHKPSHWASNSDIITADSRPQSVRPQPQHWPSGHKPNKWASQGDLITADDGPSQWPASHRPHEGHHHSHHSQQQQQQQQHQSQSNHPSWPRPHPPNHPEAGPGEWVLLSSTKGYSLPSRSRSRQRAMTLMTSAPLNTKRTVRLTVLPADPAHTATSHGGMLEVEKTFQTVDESRERDRISRYQAGRLTDKDKDKETAEKINDASSKPKPNDTVVHVNNITVQQVAEQVVAPSNSPSPQKQELQQDMGSTTFVRSQDNRRTATLAAIGAGMLPATMALLVPMMLGRKKRNADATYGNATRTHPFQHRAF